MKGSADMSRPTRHNPHPFLSHLIQSDLPLWQSYVGLYQKLRQPIESVQVRHPFVIQLGRGTLPQDCFQHYIIQDYHYLRHCASASFDSDVKADE
jgi:hydroxymethylpyrimidine/phosphomethylpyrimidine kinase